MITGDNPLTAVHVAKDVEIIDREALILDIKENAKSESGNHQSLSSLSYADIWQTLNGGLWTRV